MINTVWTKLTPEIINLLCNMAIEYMLTSWIALRDDNNVEAGFQIFLQAIQRFLKLNKYSCLILNGFPPYYVL